MTPKPEGWRLTRDYKMTLPSNLAASLLQCVHRTAHKGTKETEDLVRKADLKIFNLRSQIRQTASRCLSRKLTNAEKQPEDEGCPTGCSLGYGLH